MGTKDRRDREREQMRTKIMDAARELFITHGYEAVSMRKIAEAIEYSPTAIYVHFEDKEALFWEVCAHDFLALAHASRELAQISDPVERIRQIGHAYIRFALEHPNHYRLMFMTPHRPPTAGGASLPDEVRCRKGNPDEDSYAFLKLAVVEAIHSGRFHPDLNDADLIAQTLWAAVHGVASLEIIKAHDTWLDWRPVEDRARTIIDAVLRGLTTTDPDQERPQ